MPGAATDFCQGRSIHVVQCSKSFAKGVDVGVIVQEPVLSFCNHIAMRWDVADLGRPDPEILTSGSVFLSYLLPNRAGFDGEAELVGSLGQSGRQGVQTLADVLQRLRVTGSAQLAEMNI